MSIYIFYHVHCNDHTVAIVESQVDRIIYSGLYDHVDKIFYFLTGNDDNRVNEISEKFKTCGNKFALGGVGVKDTTFERFTLLKIRNHVKDDDRFLYMHTKGVTKPNNRCITDWRSFMEYHLVKRFDECLEKLKSGADTVGCNLRYGPEMHYSGNFWWTTGRYFRSLPQCIDNDYYLAPEMYLCQNKPNARNMADSQHIDHYYQEYHSAEYVDSESLSQKNKNSDRKQLHILL